MATVNFRLRSKANKNVSIKVYLSIVRGNFIELGTGFSINPKDWSKDTDRPKQNNPENKITFNNLKKLESFLFSSLNTDLGNGILIDSYWLATKIKECFNRVEKTDTGLLVNHIQYIIDNANTRKVRTSGGYKIGLSKNTIKNYNSFKNIIVLYQKTIKQQIHFISITKPFVEKFTNYLFNTKEYSTNYSGKILETLKTVCIDAEKNEIDVTPYSKTIQTFRKKEQDKYIQTLNFTELYTIKNLNLTNQEQLNKFKKENPVLTKGLSMTIENLTNVRNWMLLGCEIGQRGKDLIDITPQNIRYNGKSYYLDIVQQKTDKSVTVPVIAPHAIDIIEKHFPNYLPIQKLNEYSKVVCKIAGIIDIVEGEKLDIVKNRMILGLYPKYELIASHCFRRSFASNYYKKIPTPILINITGHSKESLFLTYINKREDKDANADLFVKFFEDMDKVKEPQMRIVNNNI
jgi:integrase